MSKQFIPTGDHYHKKLHILWNTQRTPYQISEIRLIQPSENPRLYWEYFAMDGTVFHEESPGTIGYDAFSDQQAQKWGIEGFLLGLVLSFGGLTAYATDMLRYDLDRLKINGWEKVVAVPRSKSLFDVHEWEQKMLADERVQRIIA